jgi:multiple sugar transport system permease protein
MKESTVMATRASGPRAAPSFIHNLRAASARFGKRAFLYAITLLLSLAFVYPLLWTLGSSLKTPAEMFLYPPTLFPASPQFANYVEVMETVPFAQWFLNTVIVVVTATAGTVISASMVAYSFARFRYRGRDLLFLITLTTMMLPSQVTLVPQFIIFYKLGWIDTIKPLWVPQWFGGGAFYIFLMRQFFLSLPRELDEAAIIDGANRLQVFLRILLPLTKPALATMTVISFMSDWSDFLGPLIYLNTPQKFTLAVGLQYFNAVEGQSYEPTEHLLMTACVLTVVPALLVFFATQRYFVRGIVMTGIKG